MTYAKLPLTEVDIDNLKKNKNLTVKDNKYYSFYIKYKNNMLTISYGLFSNPLEYKNMYFNGEFNLDYINTLVLNSKQYFIEKVDTPNMRYHYEA